MGRPLSMDLSFGGTVVTDADNDPLTYTVRVDFCTGGGGTHLQPGLVISGTLLSGTPTISGWCDLIVDATDNRPGTTSANYNVRIWIADNSAPVVARPNAVLMVTGTAAMDYDTTQGETTFDDPDGDAMTYRVVLRGNPQSLTVSGARVVGTFPSVGAVDVVVTASDAFGGSVSQAFLIARAAPAVDVPQLPVAPYLYQDEEVLPSPSPLGDSQPADNRTTDKGAALGRVLFYDKRLSLTNTVSCASCHEQHLGFASPARFDVGITGIPMKRNSMSLANARYSIHSAWFWDMRSDGTKVANSLKDVVLHPLEAHDELGMTPEVLIQKLADTSFYPALFADTFGSPDITIDRAARALGQFVQAFLSYRSRFDEAMKRVDDNPANPALVFTPQEMTGLAIFNKRCNICHRSPAHDNVWQANNGLDVVPTDPGTTIPAYQRDGSIGVFRAPSLRNISVSGPYMHDGRFATLREVIEHYNSGIQFSRDLDPGLKAPPLWDSALRLDLTEADKDALEAFLNTLTDEAFLSDPKFSDPFQ